MVATVWVIVTVPTTALTTAAIEGVTVAANDTDN